jgi:hypothetical protein
MGNSCSKTKQNPILPILEVQRTPEQLFELEKIYDKYDEDCLEQHRIIQKYLREDEVEYAKFIEEYRKTNKLYVITDRDIIKRAGDLRVRKNIKW